MKKLVLKVLLVILVVFAPVLLMAQPRPPFPLPPIPLPPPIIFPAPPQVVVIPGTNAYAVPDVEDEIFFYSGWWWRPWEGRWYRSRYYDRGWNHYRHAPSFYSHVYPGWRNDYRQHQWRGEPWGHRMVPYNDVRRNWRHWGRSGYWNRPGGPGGGPGFHGGPGHPGGGPRFHGGPGAGPRGGHGGGPGGGHGGGHGGGPR